MVNDTVCLMSKVEEIRKTQVMADGLTVLWAFGRLDIWAFGLWGGKATCLSLSCLILCSRVTVQYIVGNLEFTPMSETCRMQNCLHTHCRCDVLEITDVL